MTIAFLVEGFKSSTGEFRTVAAAKALAEANSAKLFDSIEFYSTKHLAEVLKEIPREQWSLFALVCLVDFSGEGSSQKIINRIVKPAFEQLISDSVIDTLPTWLTELNNQITITTFIRAQIDEHFSGSPSKLKIFSRALHQNMLKISDKLSSENLLSFLSENADVEYVYALLGKHHINFADRLESTELLEEQKNIRKLRINLGGRSVTLEIHAGEYGKMDHFESLQHSCRTAGLIVPKLPREAPSDMEALMRKPLLSSVEKSTPSLAPRSAVAAMPFFRSAEKKQTCSHEGGAVFDLDKAAAKFDHWMTAYTHDGETHPEELVNWLFMDSGVKMVSKYEDFCSLADKLKSMGYDIPSPPEKAEFERGCAEFERRCAEFEKKEASRAHRHN